MCVSWRNDPFLKSRKQRLKKTLTAIRPHELSPELSAGLVVSSQNLLEWARSSSKAFFEDQRVQDLASSTNQVVCACLKPLLARI